MAPKPKWIVIHCGTDDSHVLVDETAVVVDEDVEVGDKVNFAYPGVKEMLEGTVKGVSDNRKHMVKLQDKLNKETKPKRDGSFHAGKPRRAAVKCLEQGFRGDKNNKELKAKQKQPSKPATSSSSKEGSSINNKQPLKPAPLSTEKQQGPTPSKQQVKQTAAADDKTRKKANVSSSSSESSSDSDSDATYEKAVNKKFNNEETAEPTPSPAAVTDVDDSHSSSGDELTELQKEALRKLAKKKNAYDFQQLLGLAGHDADEPAAKRAKSTSPSTCASKTLQKINVTVNTPVNAAESLDLSFEDHPIELFEGEASSQSGSKEIDKAAKTYSIDIPEVSGTASNHTSGQRHLGTQEGSKEIAGSHDNRQASQCTSEARNKKQHETETAPPSHASKSMAIPIKRRVISKKPKREAININYEGDFYYFSEKEAKDKERKKKEKVVELYGGAGVFLLEQDLKDVKRRANTPSALARGLTRSIFKLEAREVCSTMGKPSLVRGQALPEIRTALDPDGVDAIVSYVIQRASKRDWKIPTDAMVKQYMGNVLCEDRAAKEAALKADEEEKRAASENESHELDEGLEGLDGGNLNQSGENGELGD